MDEHEELFRSGGHMPERDSWQTMCEALRAGKRHDAEAELVNIRAVLYRRRRGEALPLEDLYPEEHQLAPDPRWGEAWNAYKAAVRASDWNAARDQIDVLIRLFGEA